MRKLTIIVLVLFLLIYIGSRFVGSVFKGSFINFGSVFGITSVPVYRSGLFTKDGKYFAYTYQDEVEKPDVKGNITMRGFSYPSEFQILDTKTGKKLLPTSYKTNKIDLLYVVQNNENFIWLIKRVYNEDFKDYIALYDIKNNQFKFDFGSIEAMNPNVAWSKNMSCFVNTTDQQGLIIEGADKRYYLIDTYTGKAEVIQGNFPHLNYLMANDFQVSTHIDKDLQIKRINGNRESIVNSETTVVSDDDFIRVQYLSVDKPTKGYLDYDDKLTLYQKHFFVLSPITSENNSDIELSMLDENTLKTVWKLQLPQKKNRTFIPKYDNEKFYIDDNQLFVANNDYLMIIDSDKGIIQQQFNLYGE